MLEGKTRRPIAHTCGPLLEIQLINHTTNFQKNSVSCFLIKMHGNLILYNDTSCSEILYYGVNLKVKVDVSLHNL